MFSEKDVHNKVDSILRKGKLFYTTYKVTGKELDDSDIQIDHEAAEAAWPNFGIFHEKFKDHPSLGPGVVEDTAELPVTTPPASTSAQPVQQASPDEGSGSRSNENSHNESSASTPTYYEGGSSEEDDNDPLDSTSPVAKKIKPDPRTKGKNSNSQTQFLESFAAIQTTAQEAYIEHERKMQTESLAFQAKLEEDRSRFEADMSMRLQQSSIQFEQQMQQQSQIFQAEIFKRLFDKNTSDKQ